MSRFATIALAAALTALSVPALAAPPQRAEATKHEGADKKFPMPADQFRKHVTARIEKARARMEAHIQKEKLPQEKADAARARFNGAVAKLNEKVEAVCADGTVTKDEAHEVHALMKQLHAHKKNHPPA